jgi:hypothetical protein
VGFRLSAFNDGKTEVYVEAFHGGTKVAGLKLDVIVGASVEESPAAHAVRCSVGSVAPKSGNVSLMLTKTQSDYQFIWVDEQGWQPETHARKNFLELEEAIRKTAKEIEEIVRLDYNLEASVAKAMLRARGIQMWEELIPREIRDRFIARHDVIRRINIYSNGDPFPWEMLYPFRKEPPFDCGQFLVEQVEICHWVLGSLPPTAIPVRRADFVLADPAKLEKADAEVKKITDLLKQWNEALQDKRIAAAGELLELFKHSMVSLLHFACHQSFDDDVARIIVKNTPLGPQDFVGFPTVADPSAFIFMNACRSDKKILGYTKMSGWANSFLGAGAGAFLGTLWEVRDVTAKVFAETLYQELLLEEKPFGEALKRARIAVQKEAPGDPTWLAYTFYGDIDARLFAGSRP